MALLDRLGADELLEHGSGKDKPKRYNPVRNDDVRENTMKRKLNARARRFHASHLARSKFVKRGLRSYFEYRDLGIRRATRGRIVAHVIRARPGRAPHGEWHWHDCDVQFVYVLKGWVLFEYEGIGRVRMRPGTCFYQPPRIRHRELAHAKDLELLEVVAPANFRTYSAAAPAARRSPARR
jgi:mannose-6-phosphate isomerase-like protein (cupin superfamily)